MEWPGRYRRRLIASAAIDPDERRLAGTVSAFLYLIGCLTLGALTLLPQVPERHEPLLLALAGGAAGLGFVSFTALRSMRAPMWSIHLLQVLAIATVAVIVASSGGAASPAWPYILLPAFFCAYFYGRPVALAYLLGCVATQALPLLYDARATHDAFLAEFVTSAPAYVALGIGVSAGKQRMRWLRARAETLATEQSALRRVATSVVGGAAAEEIYTMVAVEMATLLRCEGAGILRFDGSGSLVVVGSRGNRRDATYRTGSVIPVVPGGDLDQVAQTGLPRRVDDYPDDDPLARMGYRSTIVAPVVVGDRVWGMLAVAAARPRAFDAADEETLLDFGHLLSTAIASAEERVRLAEQALTDSLTGLANLRALQNRLEAEIARSSRRGSPLAVAMIDIDHFKEINDSAGHETGDEMLVRVARALESFARAEDTLGRVGGDEFAWLLPDTTREQALVAVERARTLIAAAPPDPYKLTISAGICDTESVAEPADLLRLADSALYWSKAHGRNQTWIYDPAVVDELTEQERAAQLERTQALEGLRALVRRLESRDAATHEHSERVAIVAAMLALRLGWARESALRLSEAARYHEIASIMEPGAPGRPRGGLGESELEGLRAAAAVSARMLEGMLDAQQVKWVAGQFAPRDGAAEPDGSALLALADTWDLLTAVSPGLPAQALAECRRLAATRFGTAAVAALDDLYRAGELGPTVLPH